MTCSAAMFLRALLAILTVLLGLGIAGAGFEVQFADDGDVLEWPLDYADGKLI